MKAFIFFIGNRLRGDVIVYMIFKTIMLHMNIIFFSSLAILNIWLWSLISISNGPYNPLIDTNPIFGILNCFLTAAVLVWPGINAIEYYSKHYTVGLKVLFDTKQYKKYFEEIKNIEKPII